MQYKFNIAPVVPLLITTLTTLSSFTSLKEKIKNCPFVVGLRVFSDFLWISQQY